MGQDFATRVHNLVRAQKVRVSEHGYDELAADGLSAREIVSGVSESALIEDYPNYPKGPCALFLQKDAEGRPVHVVWGIPSGYDEPVY